MALICIQTKAEDHKPTANGGYTECGWRTQHNELNIKASGRKGPGLLKALTPWKWT